MGRLCRVLNIFLLLFTTSSSFAVKARLPKHSQKIGIDGNEIYVNIRGNLSSKKALVLLSGPTDHWNSDIAWFAWTLPHLSQEPILKDYMILAIDRPCCSEAQSKDYSYSQFADIVFKTTQHFKIQEVIFLAFASSNLTISQYLDSYSKSQKIKGLILIDPDVLTDFSIPRYRADAEPFKNNLIANRKYIRDGKYNARNLEILAKERELIKSMVDTNKLIGMDWGYFDYFMERRQSISAQLSKFEQTALYYEELTQTKKWNLIDAIKAQNIPTVIIDTDFEKAYIQQTTDPTVKAELVKWEKDGSEFYQKLSTQTPRGFYLPVKSENHLFPLFDGDTLKTSLSHVL